MGAKGFGAAWVVLALLLSSRASAQADEFGATAEVERPIPAGSEEDPTAAATTIELADRPQAHDTLGALVAELPGAQARSLGALGAYTMLSVRGTDAEHAVVLLGDSPLGALDLGAFDLSTVPLAALERVELYRGGTPLWLDAGVIGGVLRLVPRQAPGTRASLELSAGSFGMRAADLTASTRPARGSPSWVASVGAAHSDGDFPFVHDPTPLVPGDERELARENGQLDQGHGLARLEARAFGGRLDALLFGYGRTGGIAGPAIQPTTAARRSLARVLVATGWQREGVSGRQDRPWRVRGTASLGHQRNRVADTLGEVGQVPRSTDDRTTSVDARVQGELGLLDWLGIAALAGFRADEHTPTDALASIEVGRSTRHTGSAAFEARLHPRLGSMRLEVRASGRLEIARATLFETRAERAGEQEGTTRAAPTARLAAVIEPARGLALSASVTSASRLPTVTELFGDRSYLVGDTRLRPERSVGFEGGLVVRGRRGLLGGFGELRFFALFVDDLIRYARTAQYQAVAQNIASARILGGELGGRAELGRHFVVAAAATLLDPVDVDRDALLPLRPRAQAQGRPELHLGTLGPLDDAVIYGQVVYVGANFADPANLVVLDARWLIGAGISAELAGEGLRVAISVNDLLDTRGQDILGFPLPGRTVTASVTGRVGEIP